jgi:hypothetical protein
MPPISYNNGYEIHRIVGSRSVLNEIPNKSYKLNIENMIEIPINSNLEKLDKKYYKIDYTSGVIHFHKDMEGKVVIVTKTLIKDKQVNPHLQNMIDFILEKQEYPPFPPTTRNECEDTHNFVNLIDWLFPKCNYCEKRHIRYLIKFHHNDVYLCKRCCWIYGIDSVDKYKTIDKIRIKIKNNINIK